MAQDLFGRDAGNVDAKSMMQSLSGKVSQILETKDTNAETALAKVVDAVNQLASKIDAGAQQEANDAAKFANSVIQCYQDIFKKSGKEGEKRYKGESVEAKLSRKAIQQIVKMGASPNTFWVGIGHFNNKAINQFKRVLVDCGICGSGAKIVDTLNQNSKKDKTRDDTKSVIDAGLHADGPDGAAMGGGPGGGGGNFHHVLGGLRNAGLILAGMLAKMGDMFETKLTDSFKGVLIHSNKLRENLRTVIFQTQGYSETNRAMEKDFMDLRQATISSGVAAAKYDEQWVKNLQLGFGYMSKAEKGDKNREQILQRQVRTHKSVQTAALNTAATLGMSVDGTNDMFMSWHMQLGMSANELANMGRSMKQISLSTGVTGANLEKAMKSADAVMRTMRDTGSLTDTAAENVMNMTALAQKFGVEDTMNPLLKAMSGGTGLFDADAKTQKLLNSMMTGNGSGGKPDEMYWSIRSGNILNDKKMMAQGQENMATRARTALKAAGVKNADTMDLSNITQAMKDMSQQQQALVQSNFQTMVGALPGEFQRVYQTLEEAKKTDGQKLEEITKEINSAKARGAGGLDSTKALERKKNELESGNIQQVFGKISDQMKQGKTLEDAQATVYKETEGKFGADYAAKLIGDMGGSANKLMSTLQDRAKASGKNLDDVLKAKGMSEKEIRAALVSGNKDQRITATGIIDEAMQEIGQAESANRDPITKINEGIRLINNNLQRLVDNALFGSDMLVQILFWTTKIAGLAGVALGLLGYLPSITSFFGTRGIGGMMGGARNLAGRAMAGARTAGTTALAGARTAGTTALAGGRAALASAPAAARTALAGAGPIIGNAMSRALGPLILALGAVKGVIEAETAGRTKLEGGILGALTGGAGTGSFMSSTLGLEKGGVADKSLGVAGGAAWGAAAGAAIGVWFGGIGAGPGALIGAAVGAVAEMIKILTEGTTILADIFSPIQELIDGIWKAIKGVFGLLWSIVTLNFSGMFQGLYDIVDGIIGGVIRIVYSLIARTIPGIVMLIYEALKAVFYTFPVWLGSNILAGLKAVFITFPIWAGGLILSGLKAVFVTFPSWLGGVIMDGLKAVFVTFPSWLGGLIAGAFNWVSNIGSWIKDGLASLATNEWVGPIFSVLAEAFDALYEGWMEIYKPLKDAFNEIYQIFADIGTFWSDVMNEIYKELKDIIDPIASFFSGIYEAIFGESANWTFLGVVLSGLKVIVNALAQAIAFVLKPIVWLAKILGVLLKVVGGVVKAIATFVTGIMQVIKGLLTFDGNAIMEGLTKAFVGAPMVIYNMFMTGVNYIAEALKKLPSWLLNMLGSALLDFPMWLGGKMLDGLQAVFVDFPVWLFDNITNGLAGLGNWIYENVIQKILDLIPDWIKTPVAAAGNVMSTVGGAITDPIGTVKSLGSKALDVGGAVLDYLNPFSYFAEGTKSVKQPGLAVLHEGEMVVPKSEVKAIAAIGNGPFGSASSLNSGAFESDQGHEAIDTGWAQKSAEMMLAMYNPENIAKGIGGIFDALTHPFQTADKVISGTAQMLTDPVGTAEKLFGALTTKPSNKVADQTSGGIGLGIFDPENIGGAFEGGVGTMTSEMSYDAEDEYSELVAAADRLIDALYSTNCCGGESTSGGIGLGLFDPVNIVNAMQDGVGMLASGVSNAITDPIGAMKSVADAINAPGQMIYNRLTSAFAEKSKSDKSDSRIADAGKAMYYSDTMENLTQGVVGSMVDSLMNTPVGKVISSIVGGGRGETSTNLLDYSDSTKGSVAPSMFNMSDTENRVAQEKYGSMPAGSIPGMSGIEEYLAQEQNMMKVMIEYLAKIENNTSVTKSNRTGVVGQKTKGLPADTGLKMRRISQEQSSGEWDVTFGDYIPSATTTG